MPNNAEVGNPTHPSSESRSNFLLSNSLQAITSHALIEQLAESNNPVVPKPEELQTPEQLPPFHRLSQISAEAFRNIVLADPEKVRERLLESIKVFNNDSHTELDGPTKIALENVLSFLSNCAKNRGRATTGAQAEAQRGTELQVFQKIVNILMTTVMKNRYQTLGRFFDKDRPGEWQFPKIHLQTLMDMPDQSMITVLRTLYGAFQNFADFWTTIAQDAMNSHDSDHIRRTMANLENLLLLTRFSEEPDSQKSWVPPQAYSVDLTLSRKALLLSCFFHDIGVALGGKDNHEANSVAFLEEVIDGWDNKNPFCRLVKELILQHVTGRIEQNFGDLNQRTWFRVLQSYLILADEGQFKQRLPKIGDRDRKYASDPYVRIAKHVAGEEYSFKVEAGVVVAQLNVYAESKSQPLSEPLKKILIKSKKTDLIRDCFQNIFGRAVELRVSLFGNEQPRKKRAPATSRITQEMVIYRAEPTPTAQYPTLPAFESPHNSDMILPS